MLCQFTVRNFRCIKDELTLDMQATSVSEHTESLIESQDGERFLPLAVLYGPNGAGKSTVLLAIYGLICKIMRPVYAISYEKNILLKNADANVLMKPFAFSPNTVSQPTEYEIFFRTKDYEYQYQLAILKEKIVSEALFRKKISGLRYSRVFSRDKGNGIMLKGSLRGYNFDGISHDLPLLSYLGITHKKNAVIKDVMDWFDHHLCYIDYGNPLREARIGIPKNEELKRLMLEMLSEMGIDVTGYRVEEDKKNVGEIANGIRIFTQHKVNHDVYELELSDESSGTIKMFGILPAIAMSIARGQTLIVDELDAKIHPVLLKYIISLYSNPKINTKKAQLIFTSHDLSTMNQETFRRDEIWFVAKGIDGGCNMYSLSDFKRMDGKACKEEKYSKRYLEGRYGADPYLRRIIQWEEYHVGEPESKEAEEG